VEEYPQTERHTVLAVINTVYSYQCTFIFITLALASRHKGSNAPSLRSSWWMKKDASKLLHCWYPAGKKRVLLFKRFSSGTGGERGPRGTG